jgi:CRISPR-associated exonuclease Cas4
MEDYVRVSDISNYLKCPRIVYYANQGHQPEMTTTPAYIAALLIKEMAHSFAEIITSENLDNDLEMLLEDSALNLAAIYRDDIQNLNDALLNESVKLVRSWIGEIKAGIIDSIERFKVDRLVCMLTSHSTEPILYSKKYRLSGTPDRVLMLDKAISLSIIRTGKAPETGIWKNDRIRLTALSILVEEEYDCLVDRSIVEYARYGIVREVQIKRADRRKVLALASRIRKIRTGKLPQRPEDPPCDYCGYKSFCNVTPTLASRFF